jgi:hypothetical protein
MQGLESLLGFESLWRERGMKRRLGILALALGLPLMAVQADASPIAVSFNSGNIALQTFFGDNFSFSGTGGLGSLTLDTAGPTTGTINQAVLNIANYTNDNGGYEAQPLALSFDLTLGGITHQLSQSATWSITPTYDSVFSAAASAPVTFDTAGGSWNVTLNSFSVGGGALGTFSTPETADFRPVPEPASILLFGTAFVGGAIKRWRKRRVDA